MHAQNNRIRQTLATCLSPNPPVCCIELVCRALNRQVLGLKAVVLVRCRDSLMGHIYMTVGSSRLQM